MFIWTILVTKIFFLIFAGADTLTKYKSIG